MYLLRCRAVVVWNDETYLHQARPGNLRHLEFLRGINLNVLHGVTIKEM